MPGDLSIDAGLGDILSGDTGTSDVLSDAGTVQSDSGTSDVLAATVAPIGTGAQYEQAADATLLALRQQYDAALSANGLSQDSLASTIAAGPSSLLGFFDTTGRVSIAKNLQTDGGYIDDLAGRLRTAAETGTTSAGDAYDWNKWAAQAQVVGQDLSYQSKLAWDASVLGPLQQAATATLTQAATTLVTKLEQVGGLALGTLDWLTNPWVLGALAVGAVALFFLPQLTKAAKEVAS